MPASGQWDPKAGSSVSLFLRVGEIYLSGKILPPIWFCRLESIKALLKRFKNIQVHMGTRFKKVLFWPDTHTPLHDVKAVELAQKIAKDFKPDELVYLGDFFDCESVSSHEKNCLSDPKLLKEEMKVGRELLMENEELIRPRKIVFLMGNHEARISRYISGNAPKLGGIFSEKEILGIDENYGFLPYGQENYLKVGNLIVTHGYLAGENPAANTVKKFRASCLFGHTHKLQEVRITNVRGEEWVGINAGWLGDTRRAAPYMKSAATDWSLGFVVAYFKESGAFFHQLVHIQKLGHSYEALFGKEIYNR